MRGRGGKEGCTGSRDVQNSRRGVDWCLMDTLGRKAGKRCARRGSAQCCWRPTESCSQFRPGPGSRGDHRSARWHLTHGPSLEAA